MALTKAAVLISKFFSTAVAMTCYAASDIISYKPA
jgi:hypothetical protein